MLDMIHAKRDEIYALAEKHKAEKLWVFGSCARAEIYAAIVNSVLDVNGDS